MRIQKAFDQQEVLGVTGKIKAFENEMEKGFHVPDDEMAAIEAHMAKIANPRIQAAWSDIKANYQWQDLARTWTPLELSQFVNSEANRLRTSGGSPQEAQRLQLATKLLGNMHSGLKQDALGWATNMGLAQPQPLDFSDTGKLAASVQARMPQAEQVAAHYNQPAQYFTPDERRAIGTAIAQGGAQGLSVLGAIDQAGGDKARAMVQELVPGSPAIAALGAHVAQAGITQVALDAADGMAFRKEKDAKTISEKLSEKDTAEASRRELAGVFDKDPTSKAALVDLANSVYLIRSERKGIDHFDEATYRQGLRELVGQRQTPDGTTYGGIVNQGTWHRNPIVLPPSMKQSSWREAIDTLTPDDLHAAGLGDPVGADGKPVSMDRVKNATLVQVGDGRFLMATGGGALTPGTEGYIRRDDGKKPFVLDFNKLQPVLGARRPDLFLPKQ